MIIVAGTAENGLASGIAKKLDAECVRVEKRLFPDGEFAIRFPKKLDGEEIAIVQSTYAPQGEHMLELLLMADELRSMGAKRITAVIPFLAYMRQDKRFRDGETISIATILHLLASAGITRIITVNPHNPETLKSFSGKAVEINAIDSLVKGFSREFDNPFILAPDDGSVEIAKRASKILGCDYSYIDKARDTNTGMVSIKSASKGDLKGKQVIVLDDMISTGGTVVQAAEFAYSKGAKSVAAAAVHLIMANDAYSKLQKAGVSKVYGTNTIPFDKATVVDISKEIAAAVKS